MPIIIRVILQRIIAGLVALMVFLGISPEAAILTPEQVETRTQEQRRIIENILRIGSDQSIRKSFISGIDSGINLLDQEIKDLDSASKEEYDEIHTPIQQNQPPVIEHSVTTQQPESEVSYNDTGNETLQDHQFEEAEDEAQHITPDLQPEGQMTSPADVVVNIICTQRKGSITTVSTGSGVIISPEGVVLTNAHVAQFFILEDVNSGIDCAIYKENIPTFGYKADILYISPAWVSENFTTISDPSPRGTGEKDFALLLITKSTNPVLSLPSRFAYTRFNLNDSVYTKNRPISVAGFPGVPLSIFDLAKAGNLITDNNRIQDVFTFRNRNSIDIFSTFRSPVAGRGASGGGIFYQNDLIGVTVTISPENGGFKINAITTTYINDALVNEIGQNLISLLSGDLNEQINIFRETHIQNMADLLSSQL